MLETVGYICETDGHI
jgi:hypothetical protein